MSRRELLRFPLISMLLLLSTFSSAQLWTGIIAPSRAIDWSQAGAVPGSPGTLPDANWTQCGSTIAPYNGTTSAINTQINGCGANTYVLLGSGTFNLAGTIILKNQVVVRGAGANATFLVFTAEGSCNGLYSQFCLAGSGSYPNGGEQNTATWTAGFSQGATSITLSNSLNIVAGSTFINLDQQNEATDTGNNWNCVTASGCGGYAGNSGFARTDYTCAPSVSPNVGLCNQEQNVLVTACSPACNKSGSTVLTINPGLYMPNWKSSQSTGAWWATTNAYSMGVEDLSADLSNTTAGTSTALIMNCYECWISGVRSIDAARNHFWIYTSNHTTIQDNYIYQSTSHGSVSYGIEIDDSSDNLVLNNICSQVTDSCPNSNGGGAGNVAAYNLALDDIYGSNGWMQGSDYDHAGGNDFWLREGQSSIGFISDDIHGTHFFTTMFRNYFRGWQNLCNGVACNAQTVAINLLAASRYFNVIGNVLGQAGYHTGYSCEAPSTSCNQSLSVYRLGYSDNNAATGYCTNQPTCSTHGNYDPLTITSFMRWGNYDTVNAAVRFVSSEVPSSFADTTGNPSLFVNPVPASNNLPNSFALSGTVATTASSPCGSGVPFNYNPTRGTCEPFPYDGPDVSNGDLGNCASGTYQGSVCRVGSNQCGGGATCSQAMGGHANLNPAHSCFLDVMGGLPDGSGSVLTYNRASCYANDPSGNPPPPAPTGLAAVVH